MRVDFCLASRSERRVRLLREAGFRFDVWPARIVEQPGDHELPEDFAKRMASAKAQAVAAQFSSSDQRPVLGADTDVSVDGRILGKPENQEQSIEMLMTLRNRAHQVYSAVALHHRGCTQVALARTEVIFGDIRLAEAKAYWGTGEPCDKAGSYAVQGLAGRWIREIHGSFSGVVGLPLLETIDLLGRNGITAGLES